MSEAGLIGNLNTCFVRNLLLAFTWSKLNKKNYISIFCTEKCNFKDKFFKVVSCSEFS